MGFDCEDSSHGDKSIRRKSHSLRICLISKKSKIIKMNYPTKKFVLRANPLRKEILIVNDGEEISEEIISEEMETFSSLKAIDFSDSCFYFPFDYVEDDIQRNQRMDFKIKEWAVVALISSESGYVKAIFIVNQDDNNYAFLIDKKTKKAISAVYAGFVVEEYGDGNYQSSADFLSGLKPGLLKSFSYGFQAVSKKQPPNLGSVKSNLDEDEESNPNVQIERPAFVSNTKVRKIGGPTPQKLQEEDEDEGSPDIQISSIKESFVPNSKKKIVNLNAQPNYRKPKQQPISEKPANLNQNPAKTDFDLSKFKSFEPVKKPQNTKNKETSNQPSTNSQNYTASNTNNHPFNFDDLQLDRWTQQYQFKPGKKYLGSKIVYNDYSSLDAQITFEKIKNLLVGHGVPRIDSTCLFSPEPPRDPSAFLNTLKNFNYDDWGILAAVINPNGFTSLVLLANNDNKWNCVIVSTGASYSKIVGWTENGVLVGDGYLSFKGLLNLTTVPEAKEEEIVEFHQTETEPIEDQDKEATQFDSFYDEETTENKVNKNYRRVFITRKFRDSISSFINKNHQKGKDAVNKMYRNLAQLSDAELTAYLRGRDSKKIRDFGNGGTILKFQLGGDSSYDAVRIFYIMGSDLPDRHLRKDDFVLIGISGQGEHEKQTQKAKEFAADLERYGKDIVIFQEFIPQSKTETEFRTLAHLSSVQYQKLTDVKDVPPVAFIGSAGSGKTLISLENYLGLDHVRVLYLTYEKNLLRFVKTTLNDLGAENVNAYTFKDLCQELFSKEDDLKMQRKDDFRNWFYSFLDRNNKFKIKCTKLGGNIEDQFNTVYIFYRGIIDGLCEGYENRKGGIVPREVFLRKISSEEGFSKEQKDLIYDVAVAYEKYLKEIGGTTDNKLAMRILSRRLKLFDAIIVDEFQDLTELQFKAAISLLKDSDRPNLYIYGDDNQAINPTIFNLEDAGSIVYDTYKVKFTTQYLDGSYRSGPALVNYINRINQIKISAIGNQGGFNDRREISRREDEKDLYVSRVSGKENLNLLISLASSSDKDLIFVFPSAQERDLARNAYRPNYGEYVDGAFRSVGEAKGQEWDSVVLVSFLEQGGSVFEAMLSDERVGKHSTVHRMLFNRLYVALTRAKNNIFIYENEVSSLVEEKLLHDIPVLSNEEALRSHFKGVGNIENWLHQGDMLFRAKHYHDAALAYRRAKGSEEGTSKALMAESYAKAEERLLNPDETIELYIKYEDYESLLDFYREKNLKKFRLLNAALADSEPSSELVETFRKTIELCSLEEKAMFFALLAKKYRNTIVRNVHSITKED